MKNVDTWQQKVRCGQCNDVIYSKQEGQYTVCSCGAIAVDQTKYYSRYIGDVNDFIVEGSSEGYEKKG